MTSAFVFERGRGPYLLMPLMKLYGLCKEASALLDTRAELTVQHSLKEDKFALMVTIRNPNGRDTLLGHYDKNPAKAIEAMIKELETHLEDSRTESKPKARREGRKGSGRKDSASKRSDGVRKG